MPLEKYIIILGPSGMMGTCDSSAGFGEWRPLKGRWNFLPLPSYLLPPDLTLMSCHTV